MPRTKAPLCSATGPIADLARELRELRAEAGFTYEEMVPLARYGKTALSTADTGKRLPSRAVVVAYAAACGGDPEYFGRRWDEVAEAVGDPRRHRMAPRRKRTQTPVRPARPETPPDPVGVETVEEFRHRLWLLKVWSGLSYRTLNIEADLLGFRLARSTIGDTLAKNRGRPRRLPDASFVEALVRACGLSDEEVKLWLKVRTSLGDEPVAGEELPTPVADERPRVWWAGARSACRRLRSRVRRVFAGPAEEGRAR